MHSYRRCLLSLHTTWQLLRQTANPPRQRRPVDVNPLTRWSLALRPWCRVRKLLPHVYVGLDGCHTAFNATNAIRTTQYFGIAQPPTFLRVASARDIAYLQQHTTRPPPPQRSTDADDDDEDGEGTRRVVTHIDNLASFDAHAFLHDTLDSACVLHSANDESSSGRRCHATAAAAGAAVQHCHRRHALIALENFAPGAHSILRRRVPPSVRLVVGHENDGVQSVACTTMTTSNSNTRDDTHDTDDDVSPCVVRDVLYIPQYGTISSLNVVTALGIALFYAYVDAHHPHARTLAAHVVVDKKDSSGDDKDVHTSWATMQQYQRCFSDALPRVHCGSSSSSNSSDISSSSASDMSSDGSSSSSSSSSSGSARVDVRPLHPAYYTQTLHDIRRTHAHHRDVLLRYSRRGHRHDDEEHHNNKDVTRTAATATLPRARFGLSVLYENECDERNFGGLVRSANAFLVDCVCYVGRRKYNVVGALGCQHYTPPVHIPHEPAADTTTATTTTTTVNTTMSSSGTATAAAAARASALQLRERVEAQCGGACRWWLLDCGHDYAPAVCTCGVHDTATMSTNATAATHGSRNNNSNSRSSNTTAGSCVACSRYYSSPASLQWWHRMTRQDAAGDEHSSDTSSLCLCDDEATLRRAAGCCCCGGDDDGNHHAHEQDKTAASACSAASVLLVVPQEGKLPHMDILTHCERVVTVLPRGVQQPPGLPTQVASGIALQRLSAVLHPRLAAL